ncbi:MAG TPA: hypothetical protein VGX76_09050, partial [Pirellulales bacterium]|nr:hypothetical protein [Pirellulales bacterium]
MSWSQYAMGGGPHHGEPCAGQDGCVPQRVLWGYYPTIWRRWPTDRAGKPLKSAPELVPTPAKQPPASDQVVPPTTTPATPPTTEPGLNLPPTQPGSTPPGMTLPGDELPLPGDESTPQQRGPAETTEPPKEVAPPAQLAPPT